LKKTSHKCATRIVHEARLHCILVLSIILLTWLTVYASSAPLLAQSGSDFTLTVYPSYFEARAGRSVTYPVFCNSINNFAGTVSLSLNGVPSGVIKSYSFSVNPIMLTANSTVESDLTITTDSGAQPGYYSFTVNGSSSSLNHSYQINLSLLPGASSIPSTSLILLLPMLFVVLLFSRKMQTAKLESNLSHPKS
jgi:hypothetical protein